MAEDQELIAPVRKGTLAAVYKASRYNVIAEAPEGRLVLYNTLSHILSVLTPEEARFYRAVLGRKRSGLSEAEHGILDELLVNHFLVPADVDELALVEARYTEARQAREYVVATVAPTLFCNFTCHYCYQGQLKERQGMTPEVMAHTARYLIAKADPKSGIRHLSMTWFGGEPLLGKKVIYALSDELIAHCTANGLSYSATLVTNGYLLTADVADELHRRKVGLVQISMDGARDTHNSIRFIRNTRQDTFDRIVENIRLYSERTPLRTSIRVNVDQENAETVDLLIDQLAAAGLGHKRVSMYFAPVESSTSACRSVAEDTLDVRDFASLEYGFFRKAWRAGLAGSYLPMRFMGLCGATREKGVVIVANGDVHKCWETVSFPERRTGHVRDLPTTADRAREAQWAGWSPFQNEHCRACRILPNCAGFCPYKFLYKEEYAGASARLPCPSLKFNIEQKVLHYAAANGMLGEAYGLRRAVTAPMAPPRPTLDEGAVGD